MMEAKQLDSIFAALADSTRRAILARLASGEASVSELAEPFQMSQPAISKHLKILQEANLITSQVDGQRRPRELNAESLIKAMSWIERYREVWEQNYLRLDAVLEELKTRPRKNKLLKKQKPVKPSHPRRTK